MSINILLPGNAKREILVSEGTRIDLVDYMILNPLTYDNKLCKMVVLVIHESMPIWRIIISYRYMASIYKYISCYRKLKVRHTLYYIHHIQTL